MSPAAGRCTEMTPVVGMNQGAVMQSSLEVFLNSCARHGVRQVELRAPKVQEALYHMAPAELQSRLNDAGVVVTAVNSLDDFALVPDENLAILEREAQTMAQLCVATRCDLAVAPVGRWFTQEAPSWDWVRERSADRLRRVEHILSAEGIRVGVEPIAFPHFTIGSLEESMEIIDAAGSASAVLVADVYNLMQGRSTVESMEKLARRIGMLHVNDAPHRRYSEMDVMYTRLFPGDGILEPETWVMAAQNGGYDGPVSMEIFMKQVWEMDGDAAVRLCAEKAQAFEAVLEQQE